MIESNDKKREIETPLHRQSVKYIESKINSKKSERRKTVILFLFISLNFLCSRVIIQNKDRLRSCVTH